MKPDILLRRFWGKLGAENGDVRKSLVCEDMRGNVWLVKGQERSAVPVPGQRPVSARRGVHNIVKILAGHFDF